ncbi:MAG: hypothetical protein OXQ29_04820 [Rhodospirillaceae bacterium]|nr:hypothetical protein [Rhodospirillaceae bacterium]
MSTRERAVQGNEGKCCDAVLRVLERRTGEVRQDLHVDPGGGPGAGRVDICAQLGRDRYALEHTRIEPFEAAVTIGIKLCEFVRPIKDHCSGVLPGPAIYHLALPQDLKLGGKSRKQIATIQKAQKALIDWISAEAPRLYDRAATSGQLQPRASTEGEFPGLLPYRVALSCILTGPPSDTEPGMFGPVRGADDDLEQQRIRRLRRALLEKCPKLQRCKAFGARTVLVLECGDPALSDSNSIREALNLAAEERVDMPDEIYLVKTVVETTWYVWPMNSAAETGFPSNFNIECKSFESASLEDLMFRKIPEAQ